MDERRLRAAASSRTILNIQFELKTFMEIKTKQKAREKKEYLYPTKALI
jgi:hypothetical protein